MSSETKGSKKLRDLIRVGVFSALWIAVGWIIGCTERQYFMRIR